MIVRAKQQTVGSNVRIFCVQSLKDKTRKKRRKGGANLQKMERDQDSCQYTIVRA